MRTLGIDIETYSGEDLPKCGLYRYAASEDFAILLFAYRVDDGPVQIVDLASGEQLPEDIVEAIKSDDVIKTAWNANFERVCLSRHLGMPVGEYLHPKSWHCTMYKALRCGFPGSLDEATKVLRVSNKMAEGKALIRYFSKPGPKGRRFRHDSPDRWMLFKQYCMADVTAEQAVLEKLGRTCAPSEWEERLRIASDLINDRGVMVDTEFVQSALNKDAEYKEGIADNIRQLSGIDNPTSLLQLKEWIRSQTGSKVESLSKEAMPDVMDRMTMFPKVRQVLTLYQELTKTSCAKYEAIMRCICPDGRVRGLLAYYGARTGRWAGRLVQMQNLPQNHMEDLMDCRASCLHDDLEDFSLGWPNVTKALSELIRTSFSAPKDMTLAVCDFSAIEARVLAWLAGETWVLDAFRQGRDIYCETASRMFGVPVEKHGQNSELRAKGKIAQLALGYNGGKAALEAMGGSRMGLDEIEMNRIVIKFREASPNIVKLWSRVDKAAVRSVKNEGERQRINRDISFFEDRGCMMCRLPSGRLMCYPRARLHQRVTAWGKVNESVIYEGTIQTTRQWGEVETYGGKLTENIVQAIARDLLGGVVLKAEEMGLRIVFHVHDEVVCEVPEDFDLQRLEDIFRIVPSWAEDLPLKGAGYTTKYYIKD